MPAIAADINQNGQIGGLSLPTARGLAAGSAYAGISAGAPYRAAYVGIQPIEALRIVIRQQQDDRTNFTYPGLDAQVQLANEGEWIPAAALGYTHFVGQRRFGGEYLVFSKRWWDLDFNVGLGWGRYANHGALKNPFAAASSRYQDAARDNGGGSTGPGAWYRGDRMGLFGGVTYQTPVEGLKLIAEYDRDPYFQEQLEGKLIRRSPVNIGAHYDIWRGWAATLSFNHFSRAQLNLSYTFNFQDDARQQLAFTRMHELTPSPLPETPAIKADLKTMKQLAWRQKVDLLGIHSVDDARLYLRYRAGDTPPYARYLGQAVYTVAEYADDNVTAITVVPEYGGLTAGNYTFVRRDVAQATNFSGSPEEILQSTTITAADNTDVPIDVQPQRAWRYFTQQNIDISPYEFGFFSLSRTRQLAGVQYEPLAGLTFGATAGLESGDNLPVFITTSGKRVRSRINDYTRDIVDIENLYVNSMHSPLPGLHARVTGGLLEEMYRGVSTEILYQPFDARWAVSAEANWLQQRDPFRTFGKANNQTKTGSLAFYYEVPPRDLTVILRAEQFLARDRGLSLEFRHQFQQGMQLSFMTSYSTRRDFGGVEDRGHTDARMVLRVPLQYALDNTIIQNYTQINVGSIARDSNQQINLPIRLWEATRPISYGPILRSWDELLDF